MSDHELDYWAWHDVLGEKMPMPASWQPCENLTQTFRVFAETNSELMVTTHDSPTPHGSLRQLEVRFEAGDAPLYVGAFGGVAARAAMNALHERLGGRA